jgi:hypothetical protein
MVFLAKINNFRDIITSLSEAEKYMKRYLIKEGTILERVHYDYLQHKKSAVLEFEIFFSKIALCFAV